MERAPSRDKDGETIARAQIDGTGGTAGLGLPGPMAIDWSTDRRGNSTLGEGIRPRPDSTRGERNYIF